MEHLHSITKPYTRKRGKHLSFEDRCEIKHLRNDCHMTLRQIAEKINCSPSTVMYELRRGTSDKSSSKGRPSVYIPSRGGNKSMMITENIVIVNTDYMPIIHSLDGLMKW